MKRRVAIGILFLILLTVSFVALKLTVPFRYAEARLRPEAMQHLASIQDSKSLSPTVAAQEYYYFETDYQGAVPPRIRITESDFDRDEVRVSIYDPSARDDSTSKTLDRIYLRRDEQGHWVPYRHEWAHQGRGRFGWTTKPTT